MLKTIEAAMDSHLEGMDKQFEENSLTYTGAVEVDGLVAGASLLFFDTGLARAVVQLTDVPEDFSSPALALCQRINRHAIYRATLENGLFVLSQDMLIDGDSLDAERVMAALYMLLDGAQHHHVAELRAFMGQFPNAAPPIGDGELPVS